MARVLRKGKGLQRAGRVIALTYRRISGSKKQKTGLSLPAQEKLLREYCQRAGFPIGTEYTDIMRGGRVDRPQYQAMLTEIRRLTAEGYRVVVVVCWISRLGRNLEEGVRARNEMSKLGASVHSVVEVGGEVSEIMANLMMSLAQEEVRQSGERVAAVRADTLERGWAPVGRAGWGYQWRKATVEERGLGAPVKVLEECPEESPYVLEAFHRVARGDSVRAMQRWLVQLPETARGGRRFNLSNVSHTLRCETYLGGWTDEDGQWHQARWPALVTRELFDAVQARIAGHARVPHQASEHYLLTGFAHCPQCGARLTPNSRRRGNTLHYREYRCTSGVLGADYARAKCWYSAPL